MAVRDRRPLSTVPAPVCRPQPSGASNSSGASLGTFTVLRCVVRAWVANEDRPKKCPRISPSSACTPRVPSSRAPEKFAASALSQ